MGGEGEENVPRFVYFHYGWEIMLKKKSGKRWISSFEIWKRKKKSLPFEILKLEKNV